MNEFQAAMGLCLLDEMKDIFEARKAKYKVYERELGEIPSLGFQKRNPHGDHNYSYFPVLFENEEVLHRVMKDLQRHDIFARRYFHPSLNTLNYLAPQTMPVSSDIASRILCLPLFGELEEAHQAAIIEVVRQHTS
jgi:dTDP-4-amino-4,6-dideoxygalactose transaminase